MPVMSWSSVDWLRICQEMQATTEQSHEQSALCTAYSTALMAPRGWAKLCTGRKSPRHLTYVWTAANTHTHTHTHTHLDDWIDSLCTDFNLWANTAGLQEKMTGEQCAVCNSRQMQSLLTPLQRGWYGPWYRTASWLCRTYTGQPARRSAQNSECGS